MPILMRILLLNATTQGMAKYTRVKVNTGGIKKSMRQLIRSIHVPPVASTFQEKNIGMNIWLFTQTNSRTNVQNAVRNTAGIPACQNT